MLPQLASSAGDWHGAARAPDGASCVDLCSAKACPMLLLRLDVSNTGLRLIGPAHTSPDLPEPLPPPQDIETLLADARPPAEFLDRGTAFHLS